MSTIRQAKQANHLLQASQRMQQATQQVQQLAATLSQVNAQWTEFNSLATTEEIQAAGVEFAAESSAAWTVAKPHLVTALTILAGGMGVTVAELLTSLGE